MYCASNIPSPSTSIASASAPCTEAIFSSFRWTENRQAGQQQSATKRLRSYNNEQPNVALGGFTPMQRLAAVA